MLDPNIILRGQQQADPFESAAKGIQFGQGLRQLLSGRQAGKMAALAPEERQTFANKSMFSRELNAQLKADKAAEVQALREQQKHDADIYNTLAQGGERIANAGKTTQETGANRYGLGRDVWMAVTQSGNLNAGKMLLNRHLASGAIDQPTYDALNSQLTALEGQDPSVIQSTAFNQAKSTLDPKYNFATVDAQEANATSLANNQNTVNATLAGQQVQKEIAGDRLEFEKGQAEKPKFVKEITAPDGTVYGIYSDGSADVMSTKSGGVVKGQGGASKGMTATMQKELFETDDAITAGNSLISTLTDAIALNDKSYDGVLARERAAVAGNAWGSDDAKNTALLHNMITGNALEALKATFGSAPTEGERKILIELQGSVNEPAPVRKAIWGRAQAAAKRRLEYNQQKAEAIRNGSYTSTTYKPYVDTPPGSGVNAGQQQPNGSDTTQKAIGSASSKWGI